MTGYIPIWFTHPQTVTHLSTNPAVHGRESNARPVDHKSRRPNLAPPYLSDDCQLVTDVGRRHLHSADVHTCTVPRTQSRLGDRSFGVAEPRLWNSLPAELRQQDICFTEFRRLLKTFLFAETRRIVTSLF